jgi:hypothetical protein
MKKCPKPLGYGIRRTPVVLGLSAALCMPAAFSYANVDNGMDRESCSICYARKNNQRTNLG